MKKKNNKNERRRRLLAKNTSIATIGYSIPYLAFFILKWLDFVSYSYENLMVLVIWVIILRIVSSVIIRRKRTITISFANFILFFELTNWLLIFCYLTSFLGEIRVAALFCAFIGIIFLLTNAGTLVSLLLSASVFVSFISISYFEITSNNQPGIFASDFMYACFFMLSSSFLAVAAGAFKKQRKQIVEAKRKAEAANEAKSEFLANMSHELRTPLNHIIGFTELVMDKTLGEINATQEEYLGDVHQSSRHLLSLINDILDLSKVEAGKMELKPSKLNLVELLESCLVMVKEKAFKRSIQLELEADITPSEITADPRKLKQIIYNLLSNAVKFTPEGGEIRLRAQRYKMVDKNIPGENDSSNGSIKISVADTGIGLNPEDIDYIFRPFEQLESSANRNFQGTGLGLSLTKEFVKLHGGKIWVESGGEGKGAEFSFVIPT